MWRNGNVFRGEMERHKISGGIQEGGSVGGEGPKQGSDSQTRAEPRPVQGAPRFLKKSERWPHPRSEQEHGGADGESGHSS